MKTPPTFIVPRQFCPACGWHLDMASGLSTEVNHRRPPGPGDITICVKCVSWLKFTRAGLEIADEKDLATLSPKDLNTLKEFSRQWTKIRPQPKKLQTP